ncbi:MAG: hypothetical protein LBF27_18245 [Sphingobacterium sp.]|jgi:hypothetical protein|nr:hypothetical protein [Sphingobacterium sp.]
MEKLTILPIVSNLTGSLNFNQLSDLVKDFEWNSLEYSNWNDSYPYKPQVRFKIGYTQDALLLQFDVAEEQLRGNYAEANQNVWEDSCVELFISFDDRKHYYNIEFNLIGTGLIGYGSPDKATRNRLSATEIETVQTFSMIERRSAADKRWNLIQVIPLAVFKFNDTSSLKGKVVHGNFYKCGDNLKNPHFLSWNKVDNPTPNFHLPQFFGELTFG